MKKQVFTLEQDGFVGAYYENPHGGDRAVIVMLGDSAEDHMAVCGAKWLHRQGCHVLAMAPAKKDYGHHNYPLERFGRAIAFLNQKGYTKIGIIGASYHPKISLTVAFSPADFVMEGFFTPPFESRESLQNRLSELYADVHVETVQAEGIFRCRKG